MNSTRLSFLIVVLLATFAPRSQTQQHQARNWHCAPLFLLIRKGLLNASNRPLLLFGTECFLVELF
jgi:hypothetical protein